jgi:serine/threonine protein kinase
MGALYLASAGERGFERLCVIKTVLPHLADPEYVARFRDEAKVVVRLSHGNIVPVFDANLVDGELYLAMDYVEGKDLRAVWNRCAKKGIAFPIDVAVHISRELARGLHYAHTFGDLKLVHRDVSPPNVLISFSGEVKLTDFGLASSTLKVERTAAGIIYGKVSYMSPEQARGEPIDGRTDIYAAGIILWELLTGRQLFPQHASDGSELIERVRNPSIDPPSLRAPRVPPALDQVVLKALAKDLGLRYATGEQFRADLTAFMASNKDYVATDGARVAAFMQELFDEDIARDRAQRRELLEHAPERLATLKAQRQADMEAALHVQQRKDEILDAIRRPSQDAIVAGNNSRLREGEVPDAVREQLAAYDTDKMLGTTIERWRILRKIGEGGMGRVFEAEHREIGRKVAIKILHPVYSRMPEVVARFRMEARAASQINHPNIIEVTDSGTTVDGSFYFVMELLEGLDVAERLKRERSLPISDSLTIAHQVAEALAAAHQNNIIHRDLKPENVFLITHEGAPNFVKVLDFGIAKSLQEEKIRLTTPGMAMGTPEYMAPEQAAGRDSDGRADVYSLGAILYEMLSGKKPITGNNLMEILTRKATEDPVPLESLRPEISARVVALVTRMLSRSPEARPQTMAAVAEEITACLDEIRRGVALPTPQTNRPDTVSESVGAQIPAERRKRALFGWMAISGGVVGVLAGLYWAFTPPRVPTPRNKPPLVSGGSSEPQNLAGSAGSSGNAGSAPNANGAAGNTTGNGSVTNPGANPGTSPGTNPGTGPRVGQNIPPHPPGDERPDADPSPAPPSNKPGSGGKKLGHLPMPPSIDRSVAISKIEDGNIALNTQKNEVAFNLCYTAAGNPQVRGLALACMGEAELSRGRSTEAIKWGKRALKEKPGTSVYLLLGKSYYKAGNCKEARVYYNKVLNGAASTNPEALKGLELCKE